MDIRRDPFCSAVYAGPVSQVFLGSVYPYSAHSPLRDFITAVIKYTENCLRQARQFRARLRGFILPAEVRAVIDELLLNQQRSDAAMPVTISLDAAKVQDLIVESDSLRDLLLSEVPEIRQTWSLPGSNELQKIPRPSGTPDHLLTDLDSIWAILTRLDMNEKKVLNVLVRQGWCAEAGMLQHSLPELLIESAIEHINELALKFAGDLLIATESDNKIVAEDYRDELEYLLLHYQQDSSRKPEGDMQTSGIPMEWAELLRRMEKHHIAALRAILAGADRAEIAKIAEESATMPELLVDSINELALDAIGDVIIEPGSNPPAIEDEDLEMVKKIVSISN